MLTDQATAYVLRKLKAWGETVQRGTVNMAGGGRRGGGKRGVLCICDLLGRKSAWHRSLVSVFHPEELTRWRRESLNSAFSVLRIIELILYLQQLQGRFL